MQSRGLSDKALITGINFLSAYRSDYSKGKTSNPFMQVFHYMFKSYFNCTTNKIDKFILDANNILKAAYSYWSANRKPIFETFEETMYQMIISGDFVFSGKLLSTTPMDKERTEHAWRTLLQPFKTSRSQVTSILYGSTKKEIQLLTTSNSKYNIQDFTPSIEDKDLIPFLLHNVIKRRESIVLVGPPGCGKSCLIECITMKYGVQFFGTPDELKEISNDVQFVVFDDFDFSNFKVDDMKRLLDREFQEQRVSVRYSDAKLKNNMTRIVLCNSLPDIFNDTAVQDRTNVLHVHRSLFLSSTKRKFRGTHLLDCENSYDNENDEVEMVKEFAWSYGSVTKRALIHDKQYEGQVRFESGIMNEDKQDENKNDVYLSNDQMEALQQQSLVNVK